ncbi:MAG TPA: tRNA (guanosine(46)-N7)-methyltransferase TrmB [Gemmatimonadota bacterium]|nr:tRNA (guanosine(46)-N7)-methyltransferase TrmB [Gemmatimonadota bacterium]
MPHVVLSTHTPLYQIVERVEPFVVKERGTVWRLRDVYLNRDDAHGLAECLLVVGGNPERFFVHLAQREEDGSIVVRPYPAPAVDARPSVRRMVALVAEALVSAHPDARIAHSTIDDFLSPRWTWRPDPEPAAWDPLLPSRGLPRPLDWGAVFGSEGPVEIEIGSGKGTFLVAVAEARPDHRFLSIEWAHPYAEHVRDRVRRRELENVRVVRADAGRFLADHVPSGSVRVLHVYFPDPWPKKRHHKRRLLQPAFVARAAEALEPGGEIRFVSDHAEYFDEATAALAAEPRLEEAPVLEEMTDLTNYERKYRAEGRPIHRSRWVRRATRPGA